MTRGFEDHDAFAVGHQSKGKRYFQGVRIVSDQIDEEGLQLVWSNLYTALVADVPGDIVEFGCYVGTTSLVIRKLLDELHESDKREFHAYDSFEGLPEKTAADTSTIGVEFQAGKLFVRKRELLREFHGANLRPPIIHKGWFSELTADDVPEQIAFAFLDGDFYGSIIDSLRLVWPRMANGSKLVVDDYQREALPGVSRALHDFFKAKPVHIDQHGTRAVISVPR